MNSHLSVDHEEVPPTIPASPVEILVAAGPLLYPLEWQKNVGIALNLSEEAIKTLEVQVHSGVPQTFSSAQVAALKRLLQHHLGHINTTESAGHNKHMARIGLAQSRIYKAGRLNGEEELAQKKRDFAEWQTNWDASPKGLTSERLRSWIAAI